jgi:hypothetical protein
VVYWVALACDLVEGSSSGWFLVVGTVVPKIMVGYLIGACSTWTGSHEGNSSLCDLFGHIACIVLCVAILLAVVEKGRHTGLVLLGH